MSSLIAYWLLVLGSISPLQTVEDFHLRHCEVDTFLTLSEDENLSGTTAPEALGEMHDEAAFLLHRAIDTAGRADMYDGCAVGDGFGMSYFVNGMEGP